MWTLSSMVSILLLLELAFEAYSFFFIMIRVVYVSILLLLELAFEDLNNGFDTIEIPGFNPSSIGIGFRRRLVQLLPCWRLSVSILLLLELAFEVIS